MSLLDRLAIPQEFLSHYCRTLHKGSTVEDEDLVEAIGILKAYSLVTDDKSNNLEIPRLVQLVTQNWLSRTERLQHFANAALLTVSQVYPFGCYETRRTCSSYLPHGYAVLRLDGIGSTEEVLAKASLLHSIAGYLSLEGSWNKSQGLEQQCLDIRKELLGADHTSTLASMANLASSHRKQCQWEEAEKLELQVIEIRKKKLGLGHPDMMTSIDNLAAIYWETGRWEESEELYLQVLEARKIELGEEHPDTLLSMENLALTLSHQGRWEESEKLDMKVMETRKIKLGKEHPDTLLSMENLALTLSHQGRWEESEKLDMKVMEARKTRLGLEHPDTLTSMDNLALTYENEGRWADVESLQVQAVEIRQEALGEEHPHTLATMANLASTYRNQGRLEEAERLFMHVLENWTMLLGSEHPSTLSGMANLASTYTDQGRWQEAEVLQLTVTNRMKSLLGEDHPSTLGSLGDLASIYRNQGRCKEAERLFLWVIEARTRTLGQAHPDTLDSMVNLALTWKSDARHHEAVTFLANTLQRQEEVLGLHHSDAEFTRSCLDKWANIRDGLQPAKTEDSHSKHSAESSYILWENRERSTIPTALSHDVISNRKQSSEGPPPMSFFNFQTSEVEPLRNILPDDAQSNGSVEDEIQSLDGLQSDMATIAIQYIARTLINNSDLFGLYHEATQRMGQAKFVRNHRRILKGFYLELRAEGYKPQQKLAIDFLRSRRSRLRISHEIHSRLKPWDGTTRETVNTVLEQEKDNLFILDRFLERRGDETQLNPTSTMNSSNRVTSQGEVDVTSESSEESEDYDELKNKGVGESPNLTAIAEFLTSGQSFNSYKDNLRKFVRTRPMATKDMGWTNTGYQQHERKFNYRTYFLGVLDRIKLWRRPGVQPGHKRLTWTSAHGKPLYIDVEGVSQQQAEIMQDRFRKTANPAQPGEPSSSSSLAQVLTLPTPPAPVYNRTTTISRTGRPETLAESSSGFNLGAPMPRLRDRLNRSEPGESRPSYLLLCITTRKSVSYRPIDVTNITHDQFLFQAIREEYFSIKNTKCWTLRLETMLRIRLPACIRLCFESLELFTPRCAELVSFFLMPIPKGQDDAVCPLGFQLSYPPEHEVWARRWDYRPCPKSFNYFQMNEAFVTTMLEPGHAYRDDAWLQLFPKKLNSKLDYERGKENLGWGIHIVQGVNASGVVRLGLLIVLGSCVVGVMYSSFSGDPGSGFTVAAWIASVATLSVASVQLHAN